MNKRQLKTVYELLESEWRDLKGIVIMTLDKKGEARAVHYGLNKVEETGLADWFQTSVRDDFRETSWRAREIDSNPLVR